MNTVWAEADEDIVMNIHDKYDRINDQEREVIIKLYGIDGEEKHFRFKNVIMMTITDYDSTAAEIVKFFA